MKYFLIIVIFIIMLCLNFVTHRVLAQEPVPQPTPYKLLAPLPGYVETTDGKTTAALYIEGVFRLIIAIAGVLAVVMIIFGGIKYMSTDAFGEKSEAKNTIQNAIWGLLLVIGAWLILYTVNPRLLTFNLDIPAQTIPTTPGPGPGTGAGRPMTPEEIAADRVIRDRLEAANVDINAAPCLQGQGYQCTNLNGLPESTVQGLISMKSECGPCVIRVSGGTEPGPHVSHGPGRPVVDLSDEPSLRSWLRSNRFFVGPGETRAVVRLSNGRQATFVFERAGQGRSTGDHWHVQM